MNNLSVFFSNRMEGLYESFVKALFNPEDGVFARRVVIVPSPAMKSWLMQKIADDKRFSVAAGMEVYQLTGALSEFFPTLFSRERETELALALEGAIRSKQNNLKPVWKPLNDYLGDLNNKRGAKRLTALSCELAALFLKYEQYGQEVIKEWKESSSLDWQKELFFQIKAKVDKKKEPQLSQKTRFYLFGISFLTAKEHQAFCRLSEQVPVFYYLLSPCAAFWSDIVSDTRGIKWLQYLEKKGVSQSQIQDLEGYLYDRNPLLANFGSLGREMAQQIEASSVHVEELYHTPFLPDPKSPWGQNVFESVAFCDNQSPSLLTCLQADLLYLRNPKQDNVFELNDQTVQIHAASSYLREVQVVYNSLLSVIDENCRQIKPEDIVVMVTDLNRYEPFIRAVFEGENSVLSSQIMDLKALNQSGLIQAFFSILALSESRWDVESVLALLDYPAFVAKQGFTIDDCENIRLWVKQTETRWGEDQEHRDELLEFGSMSDKSKNGTWKAGFERLLLGLIMEVPEEIAHSFTYSTLPLNTVESSQAELLGNWITLLKSLRSDLKLLKNSTKQTVQKWGQDLRKIAETYLRLTPTDQVSEAEVEEFLKTLSVFESSKTLSDYHYPFTTIYHHLKAAVEKQMVSWHETNFHSVRFCSMLPMRAVPAKVVVLMGMDEQTYPKQSVHSSLDLIFSNPKADYCPTRAEFDRYLLLEAYLSARNYLFISYTKYNPSTGKETLPSLVVKELTQYFDQYYSVGGDKFSERCVFHHPFVDFDKAYFDGSCKYKNFSQKAFLAACAYYGVKSKQSHCFIPNFIKEQRLIDFSEDLIDLKNLEQMAKNPLAAYFNKRLGIYLYQEEETPVDERFVFNPFEKARLVKNGLKNPVDQLLAVEEKKGALPVGPFADFMVDRLKADVSSYKANLADLGVDLSQSRSIELRKGCREVEFIDDKLIIAPALQVSFNNRELLITGRVENVTDFGLVVHAEDKKSEAVKIWPTYLLYCQIVKTYGFKYKKDLIFSKSAKIKPCFFDDTEERLVNFLDYYFAALNSPSPLIPDWLPEVMQADEKTLDKKINRSLFSPFSFFYNDYIKWLTLKTGQINSKEIIDQWGPSAENLFSSLFNNWYKR